MSIQVNNIQNMAIDDEVKNDQEEELDIPEDIAEVPEDTEADFPIGSPVSTFDDEIEDEDPHASFDVAGHEEDPHMDPYGVGAPDGYEDDEEDDEELLEEEIDSY